MICLARPAQCLDRTCTMEGLIGFDCDKKEFVELASNAIVELFGSCKIVTYNAAKWIGFDEALDCWIQSRAINGVGLAAWNLLLGRPLDWKPADKNAAVIGAEEVTDIVPYVAGNAQCICNLTSLTFVWNIRKWRAGCFMNRQGNISKLDRSIARSIARSNLARSFDLSIARSLARSIVRSLDRSIARSLARSVARSLDRSIARLFTCMRLQRIDARCRAL